MKGLQVLGGVWEAGPSPEHPSSPWEALPKAKRLLSGPRFSSHVASGKSGGPPQEDGLRFTCLRCRSSSQAVSSLLCISPTFEPHVCRLYSQTYLHAKHGSTASKLWAGASWRLLWTADSSLCLSICTMGRKDLYRRAGTQHLSTPPLLFPHLPSGVLLLLLGYGFAPWCGTVALMTSPSMFHLS